MNEKSNLNKDIEDIITNDINRPLTEVGATNKGTLLRILKAYASYNSAIGYCQGMSFLAEYIFMVVKDEMMTFRFLCAIINKYGMAQQYVNDLPLLKKHFYQLDRILYARKPNLTAYFRNEGIGANFFSSAWFMTLFTHILRSDDKEISADTVLAIWDTFLLYGWKAIFKASIFVVEKFENKLMETKLEQVMMMVKEISKPLFLHNIETIDEYKDQFNKIKITNEELELYENEYFSIKGFKIEQNAIPKGAFHI